MSKFVSQGQQRISSHTEDGNEELNFTIFLAGREQTVIIAEPASLYWRRRFRTVFDEYLFPIYSVPPT
jgi:hypothetical protein